MKNNLKETLVERLRRLFADEKQRVNLLVALGLAGMVLIGISDWLPGDGAAKETPAAAVPAQTTESYAAALETRLETLIAQVDGAGKVQVMVTLAAGEETVYAQDSQTDADGSASRQHVLVGDGGLVETTNTPAVLGVAVVCEGGGDTGVQYQITQLVEALTDAGASHITVTKMAAAE